MPAAGARARAYAIWQREGGPDGSAEPFWLMAEEELPLAERQGPSSGSAEERPDRPRDQAQVDRDDRLFVSGQRSLRLDQRDRCRRAQGGEDVQAILTAKDTASSVRLGAAMYLEGIADDGKCRQ